MLRPKPPLGAWEKAWVETEMHRLAQWSDRHLLLDSEVILPTADFFPGEFQHSAADAQGYLDRVLRYLRAEDMQLKIEVYDDRCCNTESRVDRPGELAVLQSSLNDPQTLVASLAHRVSCLVLERHYRLDRPVHTPWVADLLTVSRGLGIFGVNAADASGRLPTRMLGYALGLYAWIREETRPSWASHLVSDGAIFFQASLRYLQRTHDSLFRHATLHLERTALSVNELVAELDERSDSIRIAALWSLAAKGTGGRAAEDAVSECLHAREAAVRAEAATALAAFGTVKAETLTALADCLRDAKPEVRTSAAQALGSLAAGSAPLIVELGSALSDDHRDVVAAAAIGLARQEAAAASQVRSVLSALRAALVRCDQENSELLAATLRAIVPDAEQQVLALFDEYDAELKQVALEILAEQGLSRAT